MAHALFSISWHDLLLPKLSWGEKLLRPVLVYLILLVLFRVASKRELAQATLFDFLIILMISNVVQNAMIGDDSSILGGGAGAVMLIFLSYIFNHLVAHNKTARVLLEGKPICLIKDGEILCEAIKKQQVSRNDLFCAIRKRGLSRLADVEYAILELDGTISILNKEDDPRPHDCLPPEIVGEESAEEEKPPAKQVPEEKYGDWNP